MKYKVQITELLRHTTEVEAETVDEARQQVMQDYYDNAIELTADDYVDGSVQFEVVS